MNYTFQFGVAFHQLPGLLKGAVVTFELGLLTFWGGALIGLLFAALKTFGGPVLRRLAGAYVIFFTNTPALIQIYFLYFGLPDFGIRWDPFTCTLIGLTLNAGAYLTEIMRAGFISVHRNEMEAAVQHKGSANPGPYAHEQKRRAWSAKRKLRQGVAIDVVIDRDGDAQSLLKQSGQRHIPPAV